MTESRCWTWRSAITRSRLPSTTRHILHVISFHMNEHGANCFPSQETIALETGYSRKSVNEHIQKAVDAGWLKVQQHGYRGQKWRRNEYVASWPEREMDAPKGSNGGLQPSDDEVVTLTEEGCNPDGDKVVTEGYTNPPRNPPKNPPVSRERARAENPDLEKTGTDAPVEPRLSGRERGDLIDRGVADWPKGTGRTERGIAELKKLSDAELTNAVHRIPAWLALWKANGRDHVPALSTYAGERLFNDVEDKPPKPPSTTTLAKPGGKLWHARFFQVLFGPMAELPDAATDYLRIQLAEEGPAGDRARRRHQARYGWPEAAEMIRAAEAGRGWSVPLALERVAERCQSVAVDSDLFRAWRAEHERRGWPFLDRRDAHVWLPAPIGGTAGMSPADIVEAALAAFQAGLAAIEHEETTG